MAPPPAIDSARKELPFGTLFKARDGGTDCFVFQFRHASPSGHLQPLDAAMQQLRLVESSNFVKPLRVHTTDPGPPCIVYEHCPGCTLDEYVPSCRDFTLERFFYIANVVTAAVMQLHVAGLVHGFISTRSTFIFDESRIAMVLCALPAVVLQDVLVHADAPVERDIWLPPEWSETHTYTKADDVWALALLLWEMLSPAAVVKQFRRARGLAEPPQPEAWPSPIWHHLLKPCFRPRDQRPDIEAVLRVLNELTHRLAPDITHIPGFTNGPNALNASFLAVGAKTAELKQIMFRRSVQRNGVFPLPAVIDVEVRPLPDEPRGDFVAALRHNVSQQTAMIIGLRQQMQEFSRGTGRDAEAMEKSARASSRVATAARVVLRAVQAFCWRQRAAGYRPPPRPAIPVWVRPETQSSARRRSTWRAPSAPLMEHRRRTLAWYEQRRPPPLPAASAEGPVDEVPSPVSISVSPSPAVPAAADLGPGPCPVPAVALHGAVPSADSFLAAPTPATLEPRTASLLGVTLYPLSASASPTPRTARPLSNLPIILLTSPCGQSIFLLTDRCRTSSDNLLPIDSSLVLESDDLLEFHDKESLEDLLFEEGIESASVQYLFEADGTYPGCSFQRMAEDYDSSTTVIPWELEPKDFLAPPRLLRWHSEALVTEDPAVGAPSPPPHPGPSAAERMAGRETAARKRIADAAQFERVVLQLILSGQLYRAAQPQGCDASALWGTVASTLAPPPSLPPPPPPPPALPSPGAAEPAGTEGEAPPADPAAEGDLLDGQTVWGMVAECLAVPPTATWLPGAAGDGGSDDDGGEGVAEAREARCRAALEAAEGVARAALGLERAEAVARQRVAEAQRGRWLALTQAYAAQRKAQRRRWKELLAAEEKGRARLGKEEAVGWLTLERGLFWAGVRTGRREGTRGRICTREARLRQRFTASERLLRDSLEQQGRHAWERLLLFRAETEGRKAVAADLVEDRKRLEVVLKLQVARTQLISDSMDIRKKITDEEGRRWTEVQGIEMHARRGMTQRADLAQALLQCQAEYLAGRELILITEEREVAFELAQAEKQRRHARALSTRSLAVRRQLMRLVFDEDRVRVRKLTEERLKREKDQRRAAAAAAAAAAPSAEEPPKGRQLTPLKHRKGRTGPPPSEAASHSPGAEGGGGSGLEGGRQPLPWASTSKMTPTMADALSPGTGTLKKHNALPAIYSPGP